jgi:2'-5' RNA ligase
VTSRRVDLDLGEATRWNSGVVSVLDDRHRAVVKEVWTDLDGAGVRAARTTSTPHFTYQMGDYDVDALFPVLERVAAATAPFTVRAAGLGVFGGKQPVLYVPVVRTEALSEFHRLLWGAIGNACRNAADFYWLDEWVPHVILAAEGLTPTALARAVEVLSLRSMRWTTTIDNLAYFEATYGGHELKRTFLLSG